MRIVCAGGGPAGLYLAILLKLRDQDHDVTVVERNPAGRTYGWGVVFWDDLLQALRDSDPVTADDISRNAFRWVDQVVHVQGRPTAHLGGYGFSMSRQQLLELLVRRAVDLGVRVEFEREVEDPAQLAGAEVIVACDGVSSRLRRRHEDRLKTEVVVGRNRYVWLGTSPHPGGPDQAPPGRVRPRVGQRRPGLVGPDPASADRSNGWAPSCAASRIVRTRGQSILEVQPLAPLPKAALDPTLSRSDRRGLEPSVSRWCTRGEEVACAPTPDGGGRRPGHGLLVAAGRGPVALAKENVTARRLTPLRLDAAPGSGSPWCGRSAGPTGTAGANFGYFGLAQTVREAASVVQ